MPKESILFIIIIVSLLFVLGSAIDSTKQKSKVIECVRSQELTVQVCEEIIYGKDK